MELWWATVEAKRSDGDDMAGADTQNSSDDDDGIPQSGTAENDLARRLKQQ